MSMQADGCPDPGMWSGGHTAPWPLSHQLYEVQVYAQPERSWEIRLQYFHTPRPPHPASSLARMEAVGCCRDLSWGAGGKRRRQNHSRAPGTNTICSSAFRNLAPWLFQVEGGAPTDLFVLFLLMGCCVTQGEVTAIGTPAENRAFNPVAQREFGKNTYICYIELGSWL